MASVNKVIIVGNCGRDPEIRYMPDGGALANVSIATTYRWKDKASGENKEETEWHRVTFRARLAEIAGEYLKKGSPVYVEGRLRTRKWQDKETGQDRYSTEIIADQMQLLGSRGDRGSDAMADDGGGEASTRSAAPARKPMQSATPGGAPSGASGGASAAKKPAGDIAAMDDDIPF